MTTLLLSGTGTDVGKTVVTAAVASLTVGRSRTCTVIKPGQTGVPDGGPGDLADVVRLAGEQVRVVELARYPDPLSPAAAARRSGRPTLDLARVTAAVLQAQRDSDLVLVEGAGGLLVHYDDDGFTMADLARTLRLPVLLVVSSGLGTLNSTALTLEVMAGRGLELAGLVIGSWPERPTLADCSNVPDLERLSARPLLGALAAGIGAADRSGFAAAADAGLAPALGGSFDAAAFRRAATA
ncbi:MAG: dethiobiotin synthase [Frankiales bacterium]|jgi:dethiobiotin synthase|nr:dethiobiotin synthase [Frankiales bacterium]